LKYWSLVSGYKNKLSFKWFKKLGCGVLIAFPIPLVMLLVFIPLAVIDFVVLVVLSWLRQMLLKDTGRYRQSIASVLILLLLAVFFTFVYYWVANMSLWDWRYSVSGALMLWLITSPALIKLILGFQVYEQETRLITERNNATNLHVNHILPTMAKLKEISAYSNYGIGKSVTHDLDLLEDQRIEYLSRIEKNGIYLTQKKPKKAKLIVKWPTYSALIALTVLAFILLILKVNIK
jgi:hypothetical protein